MNSGPRQLSIVMPALNEEEGIRGAVAAALAALDRLAPGGEAGEVIVVDDGSTDATAHMVTVLGDADRRVVLMSHAVRRGLGAAVRTGLAAARGEVVCYTDADLPFRLDELDAMVGLLAEDGVDVVSACRRDRSQEGPRRRVYSYVYNALVRAVLGLRVRDVNFAGKVMARRVLDAIELQSEGSFIDAELLARVDRVGFEVAQVEVEYFPRSRGVSTLSSVGTIVTMLREMRRHRSAIVALGSPSRTTPFLR